MGLKKRTKVSAEFNMSSLTDIIFLLLIFFMLTSTMVAPNSINLKLPSSSNSSSSVSPSRLDDVRINSRGQLYFNRRRVSKSQLNTSLKNTKRKGGRKASITLSPDSNAPTEAVVYVMDKARRITRTQLNGLWKRPFLQKMSMILEEGRS